MKILAFSHDSGLYGAQRSLLSLLSGLKRKGHQIFLCIPTHGLSFEEALNNNLQTEVVSFPLPKVGPINSLCFIWETIRASKAIKQMVNTISPDIIIYNTVACLSPAITLRNHQIRSVWSIRETVSMQKIISRMIFSLSDVSVANSKYITDQYLFLKRKNHLKTVLNGISINADKAFPDFTALNKGQNNKKVFYCGSLVPHKGVLTLIEAVQYLIGDKCGFDLYLFGDGLLKEKIQCLIENSRLSEHVHLMGFRKNMTDYMAHADIVVIPSLIEPFPRVGLEAMALGKPIVGANVGGICEQVVDNKTGYLFESGNAFELSEKLRKLILRDDLRELFGKAARKLQREKYSEDTYVDKYERILSSLVEKQ